MSNPLPSLSPPVEPPGKRTTIGLLVLTALWLYTALVDGPLNLRLAFKGTRETGTISNCRVENGTCRVTLANGIQSRLRNSFFSAYREGQTVAITWLPDDPDTIRGESQLARTTFMRLFAAFVLAGLWIRLSRQASVAAATAKAAKKPA